MLSQGVSVTLVVGGKRDQRPAGRLAHRPVRGHAPLEDGGRPVPHPHAEAHRSPAAGDQRRPAAVPRGPQHPGLPQHQPEGGGGGEAALGLPQLRPRARLPQLGPPERHGGQRAGVSHVQDCGPLRTALARLRGGLLRGRRTAHSRVHALRTRVLGEVREVLGADSAASRHARLPRRLPVLCHAAGWGTELRQINFPGSGGLTPLTAIHDFINKLL